MLREELIELADDPRWNDWRWQMRNRIVTVEALERALRLSGDERAALAATRGRYRWSITPYYLSLMDRDDPSCPVRRQAVPSLAELDPPAHAGVDPVGDRLFRRTNRVVHKYPDRALLLVTSSCPVYCRHCTRKYHTTDVGGTYFGAGEQTGFEEDLAYIARTPQIRDVLLSGGDPLMYADERLEEILAGLRAIPHVQIVRIGTRFPVLLPMRVTEQFCAMLERYHPVWLSTHFNHPKEVTPESAEACARLLRHGIPVQNQTVLLKGINDSTGVLRELSEALLRIRVRPYYIYHCDDVVGVSHFALSIEEGRRIVDGLWGNLTGFGVPRYVVTTVLGKIPLEESKVVRTGDGVYEASNYRGETMRLEDYA